MVNGDLLKVINRVIHDANMEAEFLKQAVDNDYVARQRLLNAGDTFQRLAKEMFVVAGGGSE